MPEDAESSRARTKASSQPRSDNLGGTSIEDFGEIARFQSPHDLPGEEVFFLPDGRHILYTTGRMSRTINGSPARTQPSGSGTSIIRSRPASSAFRPAG